MGQGASAEAAPCQAAVRGDVAAVQQWLKSGGDPNAVHKSLKGTALQAAARGDHVECLELLLRNGADVNRATEEGTALHAAASRCCHRAVNLLLRWGANPGATNAAGMTAAQVAQNLGYANLAQEILKGRSNSNSHSSSSGVGRPGSVDAGAAAKPAAGGAASLPQQQQQQQPQLQRPTSPHGPAGQQPSPGPSQARPTGQPALPAAGATPAAPQPRPYAQQWPPAQLQPALPHQATPQQWPGLQQHPQQRPQQQQTVPSLAHALPMQQYGTVQQQAAPAWPAAGQAGPAVQPHSQQPVAAGGWAAALAGAHPPHTQQQQQQQPQPGRPLKWWQEPQNQPPPPVAHSHPAYQAWLQQQAAWQHAQQAQQVQQQQGVYASHAAYPGGYGSGYATQPAAPAGFAYQHNPATGGWVLVPVTTAQQQPLAAAGPFYPGPRPGLPQPQQPAPAAHPQQPAATAYQPAVPAQQAGQSGPGSPSWAASLGATAAAGSAATAAWDASQSAPTSLAGGSGASVLPPPLAAAAGGSSSATLQLSQQAQPAQAPSAANPVASAASAPAELLLAAALHDRAEEEPHEDIGSLMPSPSAPPATNSLLDRLYGPAEGQGLEAGSGGSAVAACSSDHGGGGPGAAGNSSSYGGGPAAGAAAVGLPPGKGSAAAEEQPAEGGSPKGTIEAMVALGLADSGMTEDQEQQLGGSGGSHNKGSKGVEAASSGSASITAAVAAAMGAAQAAPLPSEGSSDSAGRPLGVLRSNASCMVDISPWEVKWEDLKKQGSIGEGAFGAVYKAMWHETQVAVKVVGELKLAQEQAGPEAQLLSSPILQNLRQECGLMASMRHPNVVQFLGVCACPPAIITEYCSRGSLTQVLQDALKSPQKAALLTWPRRLRMALDAAKGMLYLHKRGIVHRDLKSPNLLVDGSWVVKVADFNLSKVTEGAALNPSSTMGNINPRWLAPEILEEHPATCASDVYAFGITMWELLTWKLPWGSAQIWTIMGQVMSGNRPLLPDPSAYGDLPGPGPFAGLPAWIELMQRCWAQDPAQRPDFAAVIAQLREIQAMAAGSQAGSAVQRQCSGS